MGLVLIVVNVECIKVEGVNEGVWLVRSGFVVNVVLHHHLIKPAVDKLELWVIELARVPSIVEVLLELVDLVRRVPKLLIGFEFNLFLCL